MASQLQPNSPSTTRHTSQAYLHNASDNLKTTVDFSSAKDMLYDALNLLQSTCDMLNRHECYSREFEIAFWQENNKLAQVSQVNKALGQQVEELRGEGDYRKWDEVSRDTKPLISLEEDTSIQCDKEESLMMEMQETADKDLQKKKKWHQKNKLKAFRKFLFSRSN
ncbi:Uncharacterized protein HZ326_19567 [Fusarium oxysporum f. sp. albedinis]|nr:Uncharacterized protein HZ326_19567 [Fusarium oxysporum f. sp. albedinis]